MIQFLNVSKHYDSLTALNGVNFSIDRGEMAFVTGPSGAGKTTLLRLIYRAEKPDEGQIFVAGWDVSKLRENTIPFLRRNVGVIFQDFRLLSNKSIFDNVALALRIHGHPFRETREKVNEVLKNVGLRQKADSLPQHLSGGEQQRAVIARAMVSEPTVLLADEPTGNLDPETASTIMKLFNEINTRGTTVLIATHHRDLFVSTGRRVICLKNGEVYKEETG
ncbi:MAG: cell division ATP-binding protein FtsE [Nitrospirae bacterium]|nr:cell division ATP-binding protein FtsE [Nitrospirota bacterium]